MSFWFLKKLALMRLLPRMLIPGSKSTLGSQHEIYSFLLCPVELRALFLQLGSRVRRGLRTNATRRGGREMLFRRRLVRD